MARTDREGDFTVMYSADGREWVRINERGSGLGRYGLMGSAPFGTVLEEPFDGEGYPWGTGALVVATPDGLEPMMVPAEEHATHVTTAVKSPKSEEQIMRVKAGVLAGESTNVTIGDD